MTTKKLLPCSLYDIQGLQNWLDEMALQGLFFQSFSKRNDSANFLVDTPRPVRYRLDPVGRSKERDQRRKEPYAQMGWTFVDALPRMYYVFSCEDPDAPELHSDPQTLAYALSNTIQKQIRFRGALTLGSALLLVCLFLFAHNSLLEELLLMEQPRMVVQLCFTLVAFLLIMIAPIVQIRKLVKTRRALEQGLSPKAGRRWNRPLSQVVYWCVMVPFLLVCFFTVPSYTPEFCGLEEVELSHPWPTLGQLEAAGPRPLEEEPEVDGYVQLNHSWFVPVQEFVSMDWVTEYNYETTPARNRPYSLQVKLKYDQARSPQTAQRLYQVLRNQEAEYLENCLEWNGPYVHITQLNPFTPMEHPGLDVLEVARFQRAGQEGWAFAALRGNEVLVVEYAGFAALEDCLPMFLEALDQPVERG